MYIAARQNAKDFEAELGLDFCFSPDYFVKTKQNPKNNPEPQFSQQNKRTG